ncbi:MAG TPA: hypothetical protein HPP77_09970 [Candidatus Hydrogenedentes bacterium]|nr:hypothetical protein [Candidatus Hydrogenedentota bacterium]
MNSEDAHQFRMNLRPLCVFWVATWTIGIALIWLIRRNFILDVTVMPSLCFLIAFLCVLAWLLAVLFRRLFPTKIDAGGIEAPNAWGKIRYVLWEDMAKATRLPLLNIPFLRVATSSRGLPLCLPLFLEDRQGFKQVVLNLAPPHNPVRAYFEKK